MQLGLLKFMIFFLIKTIKSEKLLCNDLKVIELRRMLYLITAPLGTDFNDSNSISWIRVPDENPVFQEFIYIWQILCKIQIAKMIMIQIHSSELFLREKGKNCVNSDQNTEYFGWNCENNLSVQKILKGTPYLCFGHF